MYNELINLFSKLKEPSSDVREATFDSLKRIFSSQPLTLKQQADSISILCSNNFLFWEIKSGESDKSVGRSFSLLAICLVLENDKDCKIDTDSLIEVIHKYIQEENDFRGQSPELGWIHCWAHLGDLLAFLGHHENSSDEKLKALLITLVDKLSSTKRKNFNDKEEERLAYGIEFILKKVGFKDNFLKYTKSLFQSELLQSVLKELHA